MKNSHAHFARIALTLLALAGLHLESSSNGTADIVFNLGGGPE